MNEQKKNGSCLKSTNTLNNRFFDSSGEDSSSVESIRTKSTENGSSSVADNISLLSQNNNLLNDVPMNRIKIKLGRSYKKKLMESLTCTDTEEDARSILSIFFRYSKIILMVVFWVFCTAILIEKKEKVESMHQVSVQPHEIKSFWISEHPEKELLSVTLEGAFLPNYYANLSSRFLDFWIESFEMATSNESSKTANIFAENAIQNLRTVSEIESIPIVSEQLVEVVPDLSIKRVIQITDAQLSNNTYFRIRLKTNMQCSMPVSINYDLSTVDLEYGVIYAAVVLAILYFLIIFEIIHRTLAGMLAAAMSVAILAALDERPSVAELASWIDFETLLLLFSMMVLVAIFSETGIFDYLSVVTYKITNGSVWPLINTLCFFTFFLSSFLDNVTTALLMTPVTIRLCEVTELNPVPVLMAMMIYSNLGGALTPVGDPPNVIVASHPDVIAAGVNFSTFFLHMFIGMSLVAIVVHVQLRFMFRNKKVFRYSDPIDVQDLRQEIAIWQQAAASLSSYSKDETTVKETLLKRVGRMLTELRVRLTIGSSHQYSNYNKNLDELRQKYPIKNKVLLFKSGLALMFVVTVFFLHSIPGLHLSLGCTAFMGALLLLILADRPHLEGILARVEWSTLLFFGSLFILMEALSRLRLIEWIGQSTEEFILSVSAKYQLPMAILLILWVSAIVSAFVDNIPLTTMMIRIVTSLANNPELRLPLLPLIWALCFGACLGGISTLIGSSCNVVCAGVAEQHGHRFSFIQYSKVGLPVTLVSLLVVSAYLLVAHVVLGWNA